MEDMQEYVVQLWERTAHLEHLANRITSLQKSKNTIGVARAQSMREELQEISTHITLCDKDLHLLAKEVEHFVKGFQHVAFKESVERVERQSAMLKIDEWITKKEFKKMFEE